MVAVHAGVAIFTATVSRAEDQSISSVSFPIPVMLGEEGTLEGWALDRLGEPLSKVPVVVWRDGRGIARSTTDKQGLFIIRHLSTGTHRVVAGPATADFEFHTPSSAPGSATTVALVVEHQISSPPPAENDVAHEAKGNSVQREESQIVTVEKCPRPSERVFPANSCERVSLPDRDAAGDDLAPLSTVESLGGSTFVLGMSFEGSNGLAHPRSLATISRLPNPREVDNRIPTTFAVQRLVQNSKSRQRSRFDVALVSRGRTAFQSICTSCHDAERATQKRKSLSAWRATVRRMAAKDGADVPSGDFAAIATYLASLSAPAQHTDENGTGNGAADEGDGDAGDFAAPNGADGTIAEEETPTVSISATVSTLFRGADYNNTIENSGFFVDAWVGADWQPEGPLHGRVIACTSCHSDDTVLNGAGFTFELVEATATLDLIEALTKCPSKSGLEATIKGGRFIVPFGAFSAISHPGAYRTLTNPLLYNMGRRVFGDLGFAGPPRQPVLPMPYADEGINIHTKVPFHKIFSTTVDLYAVNGLRQSGPDLRFFSPSRSYTDNNALPAMGGRVTVGNPMIRFGGSVMTGEAQNDDNPGGLIQYRLYGLDATARFKDRLRLYLEYAMRNHTVRAPPTNRKAMVYGLVCEAELTILKKPRLGMLGRYDKLAYHDPLFPQSADPDFDVERATWGFNLALPGGSFLILNHEHWILPNPDDEIDVVGFRWVGTF